MTDVKNELAWSWSRHRTLRECLRKYYWQYYGSWGGWLDDADPSAQKAHRLKRLTSFDQLVGNAVHKAIARAIEHRPSEPCDVPAAALRACAERLFERGCEEYQLADDYYGVPGIPERRSAAERRLADAIAGFAGGPYGRALFKRPKSRLRWVDYDFLAFDDRKVIVGDGYVVFGSPDVAIADEQGTVHVIDWKTGTPNDSHRLQLAAYALFLHARLDLELEGMVGHLVYLQHPAGAIDVPKLDESIPAILDMITEFHAEVIGRLTDVAQSVAGEIERWPMTDDLGVCARCNFRELCDRSSTD